MSESLPHLRIAVTADLHWGTHADGMQANHHLVDALLASPPDLLLLGGDIGAGDQFAECLKALAPIACRKALIPGNHDIWVTSDDARGNSLAVYRDHLPRLCQEHGFHYLDTGPLVLRDHDLGIVGTLNWYDYSWSIERLREAVPDWQTRLQTKRFTRGRHNDARFVRWPYTDTSFTQEAVAVFTQQLESTLEQVGKAIVMTHHPAFFGLSFPYPDPVIEPPIMDRLLWEAFSGNQALEDVLHLHADRIPFVFCGHTHRSRENWLGPIHGFNLGGDYHFKRLLRLTWPTGHIEIEEFHPD